MKMEEGMNPAFDKQLLALGSTRAGLEHIQNMLDRGDYPVPAEREYVVRWLARERKKAAQGLSADSRRVSHSTGQFRRVGSLDFMRRVGRVAARLVAHLGPMKPMAPTTHTEAVATRKLKGEVIAFAEQVDSYAMESLAAQTAMQDERERIFLQACAVRMFRFFQAICALVKADLNDAAGAVLY